MNRSMQELDKEELFALARRDLEGDRVEAALLKLKQVITGDDAIIEALPFTARVYGQLGLVEKARACYQRYLDANPKAVLESFELGVTYFEAGEKKEAKKLWDRLLETAPTHPPTLFYSGLLAAQEGRLPDARRNLDVLFKATPADNLYVSRGRELLNDIDNPAPPPDQAPARPAAAAQEGAKPGH